MHGFRHEVDFAVMADRAFRRLVGHHLVWPRRPASLSFCSFPGRLAGSRVHFVPLIIKVGKLVDCTEIVEHEVRRPKNAASLPSAEKVCWLARLRYPGPSPWN